MAGILYPKDEPLTGALFSNPMLARQVAAQRAAIQRPDVTKDLAGLFLRPELLADRYSPQAHLSGMAGTVNQLFHKFGTPENPMGPFGFGGITAFHGSPHKFDKFDMSKMGTGEGAQAYGRGLYLAESPGVAKSYKSSTSYADAVRSFRKELPDDASADELMELVQKGELDPKVANVVKELRANDWLGFDYPAQAISAAFRGFKGFDDVTPALRKAVDDYGHLYKVDLPDEHIAKMLDWDKPLGQQPESVRAALAKLKVGDSEIDGFKELARTAKGVEMLRSVGITGVRYLDGASRAGGKGTSNFVVFDDQIPKIIGKE